MLPFLQQGKRESKEIALKQTGRRNCAQHCGDVVRRVGSGHPCNNRGGQRYSPPSPEEKTKATETKYFPPSCPSSSELDASRGVQSMSLHSNPVLCRTQHVTHKRSQGPRPFAFLPWKAMTSQALPAAETVDYLLITENIRDQEKCRKAKGMRRPVEETHETLQAGASLVHFLS